MDIGSNNSCGREILKKSNINRAWGILKTSLGAERTAKKGITKPIENISARETSKINKASNPNCDLLLNEKYPHNFFKSRHNSNLYNILYSIIIKNTSLPNAKLSKNT